MKLRAAQGRLKVEHSIIPGVRNLLERHIEDLEQNSRSAAFVGNPKPILPHSDK